MKQPVGEQQARHDAALRAAFGRVETVGRKGSVASMHDALGAYLAKSGLKRRRGESPVYTAFDEAVGRDLARRARPVRFASGVLTVEVDSHSLLHELVAFRGEELRTRANDALGSAQIRRIVFRSKS